MSDRIAEALKRLDSDIKLSRDITQRHTALPVPRLDELYGRAPTPTIYTPDEAKQFRIVEDVLELNPTGVPQPNVAVWTVGW
jgi:hypothetical protein